MTTYLLDTHALLWFLRADPALSTGTQGVMETPENTLLLSMASIWGMAIKISPGKLEMPLPFGDYIKRQLDENAITLLDLKIAHHDRLVNLPFHHRDPFDRLIICQALIEGVPVISGDSAFDPYGIERVW